MRNSHPDAAKSGLRALCPRVKYLHIINLTGGIRYFGFLANRNRTENMARCRAAVTGNQEASEEDEIAESGIELNILELT